MMTRKDFELIARVLRTDRDVVNTQQDNDFKRGWLAANEDLAHDLADALATTNPAFDRDQFLKAAGAA